MSRMDDLQVIAFDADDTLWDNEYLYTQAKEKFIRLLSECHEPEECARRLDEIEMENVRHYGYGIKSFILSMIEAALELTEGRVAAEKIAAILSFAREMLSAEVRLIDGVGETLASLSQSYPLMLITKGDPAEQMRKIEDSGLGVYFRWVEVVADKSPAVYRAILERYGIPPQRFLMVGNSLRSDILPVLQIGGRAVLVPYANTWAHEMDVGEIVHPIDTLQRLSQLPDYLQGRATTPSHS
jgi:putative hydrolase of the HAD superfamily